MYIQDNVRMRVTQPLVV